jgi:hypothetical protein
MMRMRHLPVKEQVINLNRVLRGHYACYGIAGNFRALEKVYRNVERYWRKLLGSQNREGRVTWDVFLKIKTRYPLFDSIALDKTAMKQLVTQPDDGPNIFKHIGNLIS